MRLTRWEVSAVGMVRAWQVVLVFLVLCAAARALTDHHKEPSEPDADAGEDTTDDAAVNPIKVCLDPGHPSHPGDKLDEAWINRRVVYLLDICLDDAGYETRITTEDIDPEQLFSSQLDVLREQLLVGLQVAAPEQRAELCNEWGADYFISVHHNFSPHPSVNHTLVLYGADERSFQPFQPFAPDWARATSRWLSRAMRTTEHNAASDQNVVGDSLIVLKETDMPAILTEASFYSNPAERRRLSNEDYNLAEANAICAAFLETFGTNE